MTPQETFVTRLRRHRQKYRVTIEEIAAEARVRPELLDALEQNDLSEWPRGLYARALIRTYASFVGLDPLDTVDEFCRLFPHGDRRAQATIQEIASIVATPSEYRDDYPHDDRRRNGSAGSRSPKGPWWQLSLSALWGRLAAAAPNLRARRADAGGRR